MLIEKPSSREDRERADQRHRHGHHRDQGRAPVLQEQIDDEHDEHDRLGERDDDLADALGDRQRRVERVLDTARSAGKRERELGIVLADALGDGERVRARHLEHGDGAARLTVDAADLLVVERAELDSRDVVQADDGAVRVCAHDDVAELFRRLEPSLRADRVGELLAGGAGFAPICPDGFTVLCCWMARLRSGTVRPSRASRSGLTQIRIA